MLQYSGPVAVLNYPQADYVLDPQEDYSDIKSH